MQCDLEDSGLSFFFSPGGSSALGLIRIAWGFWFLQTVDAWTTPLLIKSGSLGWKPLSPGCALKEWPPMLRGGLSQKQRKQSVKFSLTPHSRSPAKCCITVEEFTLTHFSVEVKPHIFLLSWKSSRCPWHVKVSTQDPSSPHS